MRAKTLIFYQNPTSPTKFSSQAIDSPSKVNVPRKQRNQAANNDDIEFAAEITTSLLGQVRHLQAVLAERDETLKSVVAEKSKLEQDAEGFSQRIKHMDDSEQRYKDENWSLETQLQEHQASTREAATRENRLQQALTSTTSEKNAAQQELDELKQKHGKMSEDHTASRKLHESELAGLRKSYGVSENDRLTLQRKFEDLSSQNHELARGLQHHLRGSQASPYRDQDALLEDDSLVLSEREPSPPPSPTKGGQRNSMLESETLKSSLTHAHKMIQNLKGTVNREKSEKIELKRMLQDARDELEVRRAEPTEKRLKSRSHQDMKKSARAGLGAVRNGRTDISMDEPENDPEWEDAGNTPSRASVLRADSSDAYQTANETEESFETANERDTTDNDAFQTGAEDMADESSGDLTETEGVTRTPTLRAKKPSPLPKPGERSPVQSTASTSDDEDGQQTQTPVQGVMQRFRLKLSRSTRRSRTGSGIIDSNPSTTKNSPASFVNEGEAGPSLAAELENVSGEDEGTPSKGGNITPRSLHSVTRNSNGVRRTPASQTSTPGDRISSAIYTGAPPIPRIPTVDAGTMTESWEPSRDAGTETTTAAGLLSTATAASITSKIFGNSPATPQNKAQTSQPTSGSNFGSTSTSTSTPPRPVWDQAGRDQGQIESADSTPLSTRSGSSQVRSNLGGSIPAGGKMSSPSSDDATEVPLVPSYAPPLPPQLSMSTISSLETVPVQTTESAKTVQPSRASVDSSPPQPRGAESGGLLNAILGWRPTTMSSVSQIADDDTTKGRGSVLESEDADEKEPLNEADENKREIVVDKPEPGLETTPSVSKADQSSQTVLSSDQIDEILRIKALGASADSGKSTVAPPMKPLNDIGAMTLPTPINQGKLPEVRIPEGSKDSLAKSYKKPTTPTSTRSRTAQYPPLPPDHQEAIAAAAQRDSAGSTMGPPIAPASAYPKNSLRSRASSRPQTPSQQGYPSPSSKGGTTPRAGRFSTTRSQASRRSSVSSFASELDERFNMRADGVILPPGAVPTTDPRMIQAITQTMIGEMMWKYTRKAGRGEMSKTRHPRFFWVHPYTRTLYWSERDPATANRAELKSKSVAIEAVRVVTDDNPMPPGLHRKSIIIITPGRSVQFTAQTSQRHETWFNALSYLLLRTGSDANNAGEYSDADIQEFNPMHSYDRRSARSRVSIASFKSQATANRNIHSSLSLRAPGPVNSLASRSQQQPQTVPEFGEGEVEEEEKPLSLRKRVSRSLSRTKSRPSGKAPEELSSTAVPSAGAPEAVASSSRRNSTTHKPSHASISSRISNYWKPSDTASGNRSSVRSRSSIAAETVTEPGVLEGGRSVVSVNGANDSAEDLRRMIEEREGKGNLENVRSCCDGASMGPLSYSPVVLLIRAAGQHDVADLRGAGGRAHSHAGSTHNSNPRTSSLTNLAYT